MGGMEYIRRTYKVPAKRGGRVKLTHGRGSAYATILSAVGPHLRVRLDDGSERRNCRIIIHPTWEVEYLPTPTPGD